MKITNDYTTLENRFETFDKEYQLYLLDTLFDYLMAYGKNSITRHEIVMAMKVLSESIKEDRKENQKVRVLKRVA